MNSNHGDMSAYETKKWTELGQYWAGKAGKRTLPPTARRAIETTTDKAKGAASATGGLVSQAIPQVVKNVGGMAIDSTIEPTIRAVVGLLELVTETVQELTDAEKVLAHHRDNGHHVDNLDDLGRIDLKELDQVTRTLAWRWRGLGAAEGAAMGALTFIPVAGSVVAIGADLVVMHALSTAIATHAAHAYGIDPTSDEERHHLDRMLCKAWAAQAPKAGTVNSARNAFQAGAGRVRWSDKFRHDHRIAQAIEGLMKQVGNVNHVPIDKVISKLPALAVVTSAGMNGAVLGSLAKTSVRYSQTIHLSEKYNLALPPNLT